MRVEGCSALSCAQPHVAPIGVNLAESILCAPTVREDHWEP